MADPLLRNLDRLGQYRTTIAANLFVCLALQPDSSRVEPTFILLSRNVDDRRALHLILENRSNEIPDPIAHWIERFVTDHPIRFHDQHAGKNQLLLFLVRQFAIPPSNAIETIRKIAEPCSVENGSKFSIADRQLVTGIGHD